jgi:hypothetical protein
MNEPIAEDYMTMDFLTFDQGTTEETAQARLRNQNQILGAYVDADRKIIQVIGLNGIQPLVVVRRATRLRSIVNEPDIMNAINKGLPGIFVVEDMKPVGLITKTALSDYLRDDYKLSTGLVRGGSFNDGTLGGDIGKVPLLKILCKECGTENAVKIYDAGYTKCINRNNGEHLLSRI